MTASIASVARPGGFHDGDWVESKDQDPDGEIRLLQLADVGDGRFRDRSDRRMNEEAFERLNCSPVWPGDVLIARMPDPLGRACIVPNGLGRAVTVVDVAVLRCDDARADRRYVAYAINATPTRTYMESLQDGATRQRIPRKRLGRVRIPFPLLDEQRAIADYLDRETARIDTLIEEQHRLIEMLRERRRSVASDLLGDRVGQGTRLKWFFDELDRRAGVEADTLPLMSVSISWGVRRRDEVIQDESRADDLSNYKICRRGDLVINRMRAFQGALGFAQEDGLVSPDYAVLRANSQVSGEWLSAVMRSDAFVSEMSQRVKGIGSTNLGSARTPRINIADLGEICIDLPEVEQQVLEIGQLRTETTKIDTLIMETKRFIEFSKERRAALITAAVTGQIDVREMV